jgi:hypothetical protein
MNKIRFQKKISWPIIDLQQLTHLREQQHSEAGKKTKYEHFFVIIFIFQF